MAKSCFYESEEKEMNLTAQVNGAKRDLFLFISAIRLKGK